MTDGIIKGTGNSRYLKTVANAMTLYPTYEDFIAAVAAGTFPIDLNGINPSGWDTTGTALNKANLLTDALCTALGLATTATPTQAMEKLRQLVNTAQTDANSKSKMANGSYVGVGNTTSNEKSISLPFRPLFCVVSSPYTDYGIVGILCNNGVGFSAFVRPETNVINPMKTTVTDTGITWEYIGAGGPEYKFDERNTTYTYFALG